MKGVFDFLVRSNIFVAICASSLVWQTGILMDIPGHFGFETLVVFLTTGFIYNLHRLKKQRETLRNMMVWDGKGRIHITMALFFLLAFLPLLFWFQPWHFKIFILGGILSLAYSFTFIHIGGRKYSLRTLPYSKLFVIVLVWVMMTVIFPVMPGKLFDPEHVFILLERLSFLLAITIPFDIRDMDLDAHEGIVTIPIELGWKRSRQAAMFASLVLAAISILAWYLGLHSLEQCMALCISAAMTLFLIARTSPQSTPPHFAIFMEGLSLFQSVVVAIAQYY